MTSAQDSATKHVEIHTDGACIGNPGPGGWAAIMRALDGQTELKRDQRVGSTIHTTNNRMELIAVIDALETVAPTWPVTVYTDSQYVSKGATDWLPGWKAKGWKTSTRKPVENRDLWMRLDDLISKHSVTFEWVRGHAGNELNELADDLANKAAAAVELQGPAER